MLPIFLKGMPPQFTLKYGLKKQKINGTDGTFFSVCWQKQQGTSILTHRFILSVIPAEKVSCVSLIKS